MRCRGAGRASGLALLILIGSAGCKKKGGPSPGWLVGDDGLMADIASDGELGPGYDLGSAVDLTAIACRGVTDAFVTGDGGTFLRTFDGGATWDQVDVGTTGRLRAVAADERGTVLVAGDGPLRLSVDAGARFAAIGPDRGFISAALDDAGLIGLAVDDAGTVWRVSPADGGVEAVAVVAGARAVAMGHDGGRAAVVGAGGVLAVSADAGRTWTALAPVAGLDLHAAWLGADGVLAVGAGGAIVRDDQVTRAGDVTLRAVHVAVDGIGVAAGDGGVVFLTHDGGWTWTAGPVLGRTVRGLDQIGAAHR